MVVVVCTILTAAFFLVMLAYVPWAQENLRWLSSYTFIASIGFVCACSILYLVYRVMLSLQLMYGQ